MPACAGFPLRSPSRKKTCSSPSRAPRQSRSRQSSAARVQTLSQQSTGLHNHGTHLHAARHTNSVPSTAKHHPAARLLPGQKSNNQQACSVVLGVFFVCDRYVKLGVILLYEKSLGAKSRLSQYIEQLPQSFEHPVLWTPQMVEQLQCPHIIEKVG